MLLEDFAIIRHISKGTKVYYYNILQSMMPEEVADLFLYFDSTYVTETTKKVGN